MKTRVLFVVMLALLAGLGTVSFIILALWWRATSTVLPGWIASFIVTMVILVAPLAFASVSMRAMRSLDRRWEKMGRLLQDPSSVNNSDGSAS